MTEITKKKLLITSALPYVNNTLHLGNIIGSVLSADVYARYARKFQSEYQIMFVGGVDEYGTATEMKARELGISCKELCDKNNQLQKEVIEWFEISFDCYGRTSQPNGDPSIIQEEWPHTRITHDIFKSLVKNGYVMEKEEKVLFCSEIDSYVADRFVIGTCNTCGYDKCSADQCDGCGKLMQPEDVIKPMYKLNPLYALELRTTKNLYIDLTSIWKDMNMTGWFESVKSRWTKTAETITEQWLGVTNKGKGLEPRSITRDLKWGTRVPGSDKVFYVWFDAPIGYISIMESCIGKTASESFWKDHETKLVQFMAKDNVQFHSIIFPATLKGSGYSFISNVDICATEYLMYEGEKFSKTNKTGLFCDDVMKISKKYSLHPDLFRAYLISIRPETSDSNFVLNGKGGFVDFVNNILINNIGNLIHRVLSIAYQIHEKYEMDEIEIDVIYSVDSILSAELTIIFEEYLEHMNSYRLREGLNAVLRFGSCLNAYVQTIKPWKLIKEGGSELHKNKDALYGFMATVYQRIIQLSYILEPFMPGFCYEIRKQYIRKICPADVHGVTEVLMKITLPTSKPSVMIKPLDPIVYP
jgi:methionyl-tRNA synthetase